MKDMIVELIIIALLLVNLIIGICLAVKIHKYGKTWAEAGKCPLKITPPEGQVDSTWKYVGKRVRRYPVKDTEEEEKPEADNTKKMDALMGIMEEIYEKLLANEAAQAQAKEKADEEKASEAETASKEEKEPKQEGTK